jgi:Homeodomain
MKGVLPLPNIFSSPSEVIRCHSRAAPSSTDLSQSRVSSTRRSLVESLDQLAGACERLAGFAAEAIGTANEDGATPSCTTVPPNSEVVQAKFEALFHPDACEGFDGSETMEIARVIHMNTALQMHTVMSKEALPLLASDTPTASDDLEPRIGLALRKELIEYYRVLSHGNERATFTAEQRTALESAFLLKAKLNTAEKRALARTCNLSARQVEVWVRALVLLRS